MSRDWQSGVVNGPDDGISLCMEGASGSADDGNRFLDLSVDVDVLASGFFQAVELRSSLRMSVYVPYLLLDPETGFVQNSTVVDIEKGTAVNLDVLVPPRSDGIYLPSW